MTSPAITVDDKRRTFRRLHERGCFVIPNPWDIGSALALQSLGFPALATTSSGFAWSQGRADGAMPRDRVLESIYRPWSRRRASPSMPISKAVRDDRGGRRRERAPGGRHRRRGPVDRGCKRGGHRTALCTGDVAVERLRAARQAIDRAGADCLYAPGIRTREQIAAVVEAVAPKPVNVLISETSKFAVSDLAALGVLFGGRP
jgi:2-methylisocitrate lyase-like PEP mutase family enzyme